VLVRNDVLIINGALEQMRGKRAVACMRYYLSMSGVTEENHETIFKPRTFHIQSITM
jgi:hypothetical protein